MRLSRCFLSASGHLFSLFAQMRAELVALKREAARQAAELIRRFRITRKELEDGGALL